MHDPPVEVNLGPVLYLGPGIPESDSMRGKGCRQKDTQQPAHNSYIRAWVVGPLHPVHLDCSAQSKDPRHSAHPPGGQAMRCQDPGT